MITDERIQALCREALDERVSDDATLRMRRAFAQAVAAGAAAPQGAREIMTLHEVADYLRTTPEEVDRRLAEVPCFELGGQILFRRDRVLEWIARSEREFAVDLLTSELRAEAHAPGL